MPLVLSLFVPAIPGVAARFGARTVTVGTLLVLQLNVLRVLVSLPVSDVPRLPDIFYVWVSCYGVIAPVQAWSFANSLFDTRQAKRLFGLIGAGASLGAMTGRRPRPACWSSPSAAPSTCCWCWRLIAAAAAIVLIANFRIRRVGLTPAGTAAFPRPFAETWREIVGTPYLRLLAGLVFAVAIATQWSSLQLGVVAKDASPAARTDITEFYGTFSFVTGVVSFLVQLLMTGRVLRTWGVSAAILALPLALATGNADLSWRRRSGACW